MPCTQSFAMDLMNDALWTVFQNHRDRNLLSVPTIARDEERHWILAQNPVQLAHQAAKYGPNALVTQLWSRLMHKHRGIILKESIDRGNLPMIEFLQENSSLSYNARVFTELKDPTHRFLGCLDWSALDMASVAGHENIIRYFLDRHEWSDMAIQCLVEHMVYWNHESLLHEILSKKKVYCGNAIFECLTWKRQNILKIFQDYGILISNASDDFFIQMGSGGHLRALRFLKTIKFDNWMRMLCAAAANGHARMCDSILKTVKELYPDVIQQGQFDQRQAGYTLDSWKSPSILSAISKGYRRVAKVLKKHGFEDDS